jgi:hypothetical protein
MQAEWHNNAQSIELVVVALLLLFLPMMLVLVSVPLPVFLVFLLLVIGALNDVLAGSRDLLRFSADW